MIRFELSHDHWQQRESHYCCDPGVDDGLNPGNRVKIVTCIVWEVFKEVELTVFWLTLRTCHNWLSFGFVKSFQKLLHKYI